MAEALATSAQPSSMGDSSRPSTSTFTSSSVDNAASTYMKVVKKQFMESDPDVTVTIGSKSFDCHEKILSMWSDYFRAALSTPMIEREEKSINILSGYVCAEAFAKIHTYMYHGTLDLTLQGIVELTETSHYLQMPLLLPLVEHFLRTQSKERVSLDLALSLCRISGDDLSTMRDVGADVIAEEFFSVYNVKEIITLSADCFRRVLCTEKLATSSEDCICSVVHQWLNYCPSRLQHSHYLLSKVRLGLVNPAELLSLKLDRDLKPHLGDLEEVVTNVLLASTCEGYKEHCRETYSKWFQARKTSEAENSELVLAYLQTWQWKPDYMWAGKGWQEIDIDLSYDRRRCAVGRSEIFKVRNQGCISAWSIRDRDWEEVCWLPASLGLVPPDQGSPYTLSHCDSTFYLLSPSNALSYSMAIKKWRLRKTEVFEDWDHMVQSMACCNDKDYAVMVTGTRRLAPEAGDKWEHLLACGSMERGWSVVGSREKPLTLVKPFAGDQTFYIVEGSGRDAVVLKYDAFSHAAKLEPLPMTSFCNISIVENCNKVYSLYQTTLLPLLNFHSVMDVEALGLNPQLEEHWSLGSLNTYLTYYNQFGSGDGTLLLLPRGLCMGDTQQ